MNMDDLNYKIILAYPYYTIGCPDSYRWCGIQNTRFFIVRESVKGKKNAWSAMGMKHFQQSKNQNLNMTCYERIYTQFRPPPEN
jgi:hypothetical protein